MRTGNLLLKATYSTFIQEAIFDNGFQILPILPQHCDFLTRLPFHHKDPFDRLLISQALSETIPLLSADAAFDPYGIQRLW